MTAKKKKKGKGLLFAVLILIVLLVLYFVIDLQQKKSDQEAETEETEESSLSASVTEDEISKVTVKNGDVTMTYVKNDDTWTYEEDPDFPLDESAVNTKMNCLTTLTVDRVLESPEDLSEYGLDKPQQEVTVLKTDGTTFTLYIGNQNSSNNDFYVKVDDGADVYTMPSSSVNAFNMQPYDVAKADYFPTLESTNIRDIKVENQDGNEETAGATAASDLTNAVSSLTYKKFIDYKGDDLAQYGLDKPTETVTIVTEETEAETEEEPEAETEEVTEAATETKMVSESKSTSETETGSEETTTEAVSETATEAATETESETETEEPKTIEVTTTLLIGNTNDDGDYYVKLADNNGVYTMSESTLDKLLNVDVLDYVSMYLNDVPMTNMKSLEVTYQGETKTLTVESEEAPVETETSTEEETEADTIKISAGALDDAETETESESEAETETETESEQQMRTVYHYLVDGEEVDSTPFRLFYNNLIGLQAQKRTSEAPEVSGDPDFKLVFTKVDGTKLTTEFYLADDGLYDVLSDQNLPARISKMDVQKIISYYEDVINPETETESETETASEE